MSDEISRWEQYHATYVPTVFGQFFRAQYVQLLDKILQRLQISTDVAILDVGCGSGYFLNFFRERNYHNSIGIDLSKKGLDNCQKNYGFELNKDVFWMDATNTLFEEKTFDVVFSEGILEHFKDFRPCIKEMCRISRHYIILVQPNYGSIVRCIAKILWELFYSSHEGIREYPYLLSTFEAVFQYYGFAVKKNYLTALRENAVMVLKTRDD